MSAAGASFHGDSCSCTRCLGLLPDNTVAVRHGAKRSAPALSKTPEFAEILDDIRPRVPGYSFHDEPAVQLLALTLTRVRKATGALDALDQATAGRELGAYTVEEAAKLQRLRADLRGWVTTASRLLDALAMTPTSRGRLGLDVARTEDTLAGIEAEGRRVRLAVERTGR
jgi:hypothetical protein